MHSENLFSAQSLSHTPELQRLQYVCGQWGWRVEGAGASETLPSLRQQGWLVHGTNVPDQRNCNILWMPGAQTLDAELLTPLLQTWLNGGTQAVLVIIDQACCAAANPQLQAVQARTWLESLFFEVGFRKHTLYYTLAPYSSHNQTTGVQVMLFERVPASCLSDYPMAALQAERDLHMDMTRVTGERSDAHIARYQWACQFIKPGDRILDAACGLGYGSHLMASLTEASQVLGVDGSDYAVDYAQKAFGRTDGRLRYQRAFLPDDLSSLPDGSLDVIVSFETLEHVEDPRALLASFERLLTPGGRVVISVPNDWSDESGDDPNPHHLQVYTWARLLEEVGTHFILESAVAQDASQHKSRAAGGQWVRCARSLLPQALDAEEPQDAEWWLMSAMKSPLAPAAQPYVERAFAAAAASGHPSLAYAQNYANPWLMHAMMNVGFRLRNPVALVNLAETVIQGHAEHTHDHASALCVKAYRLLETSGLPEVQDMLTRLERVRLAQSDTPMGLRWRVSLLFVQAQLCKARGDFQQAQALFAECGSIDVRPFGIHLATKTTEALYQAGRLALMQGQTESARTHWREALALGELLLKTTVQEIVISPEAPNAYHHGDGVREYTVAWDNIAKSANGLHWLSRDDVYLFAGEIAMSAQHEYTVIQADLLAARTQLHQLQAQYAATYHLLVERTQALERASNDLLERTVDLVNTRADLVERTLRLEIISMKVLSKE
jgi:2-polyprenyl-3-methyl-5-hydroxy-6-metoxy-1,4-benzoquinol methylase